MTVMIKFREYGFRPDFCEASDPQSKGIVENLVGYAKTDLMVPQAPFGDLGAANAAAAAWCVEVNAAVHSEVCAVPAERLVIERELLGPLPSLRASIGLLVIVTGTGEVVAEHGLVAPGEASIRDEHYGGPRPAAPRRAVRPKTVAEKAFCALGGVAEAFITGAAAAGHTRLGPELAELNTLHAAHGSEAFGDALARAVAFGRWRAAVVRSILAAGTGTPQPTAAGDALVLELPAVPVRPLSDYAMQAMEATSSGGAR